MEYSAKRVKHVILVGACYLDTILTVPHFPEEDSKLRATCLQVRRGGNCPNSLEVLQQLLRHSSTREATLVRPHLVTVLPATDSPASSRLRASFGHDTLIDFSQCLYREEHTEPASSYIIQSQATGSRTIVNHSNLPDMTLRELRQIADRYKAGTAVAGCEGWEEDEHDAWWHFEGRLPETVVEFIRYLRRTLPKCRISVEVEKPNREGLRELAGEADVVFYSKIWAEHEGQKGVCETHIRVNCDGCSMITMEPCRGSFFQSQGYASADACLEGELPCKASLAFCTWGAQGASAISLPDKTSDQAPVKQTDKRHEVVDTIGAGDTFVAGGLFGMLCHPTDWSPADRLRFAVDLASRKVQMNGFEGLVPVDGPPFTPSGW